jgi:soluble lytic murein transglycosylase-like protein
VNAEAVMAQEPFRRQPMRLLAVLSIALGLVCAAPAAAIREDDQLRAIQRYRFARLHALLLARDGAIAAADVLARTVICESDQHALDPMLVTALIQVESGFDRAAVSSRGAQGLMQVRAVVVDELVEAGKLPGRRHDLKDPEVNVRIGISYLAHLVEMFGDVNTALAAYNWGPTRIREKLAANEALPLEYVTKVLRAQRSLELELTKVALDGRSAAANA